MAKGRGVFFPEPPESASEVRFILAFRIVSFLYNYYHIYWGIGMKHIFGYNYEIIGYTQRIAMKFCLRVSGQAMTGSSDVNRQ